MEYSGTLPKNANCPGNTLGSTMLVILIVLVALGGLSWFVYTKVKEPFYLNQMTPIDPQVYRCPYRHQECPKDCPYRQN